MTFHSGFPRVSNHNSTDSSSLLLNLTPTEELDKESVFLDDPQPTTTIGGNNNGATAASASGFTSSSSSSSAVNPSINCRNLPLFYQNRVIEDIYEDLCYVNLRIGERNKEEDPLEESPWPGLPHDKRDYCIRELVETEKNYIDALNMIIKHFVRPLKPVLSHNDRATIFLNIKDLAEIHRGFHNDLIKGCTSTPSRISNVFLLYKEKFVIYGSYCTNLPRSQALLDELCNRYENIHQHVIQCQKAANDGKFKLRDLLSLPMQRILKYHLLLNELIKCTSESHEEYNGLKKAHDAMVDLGQYINEIKRDSETLQIIDDIQRSITDLRMPENTELKDYGRLVKDGEVKMRSFEIHNKLKTRYIFLFDKVLLMCKPIRGDQYSYREAPILADYKVVEMGMGSNGSMTASSSTTSVSSFLHPKDKFDHGWFLVHRHDPRSAYGFFVKNEETKKSWLEAFNRAYDNVNPERNSFTKHSFTLHTFTNPYSCSHCSNLLHGLFFQGYKCTICKIGVHKSCISKVRACGAPSLPPRPTLPPSSPSPSIPSIRSSSLSMLNDSSFNETTSSGGRASLPPSPSDPNFSFDQISSPYPTLEQYQWFVGNMTRETAQSILDRLPHGTFLVRISPKQGSFAISINYNGHVKHIRIQKSKERFYLSANMLFDSLENLVEWYSTHSLADTFHGLNAFLSFPCKLSCRLRSTNSQITDPLDPVSAPILDFTSSDRPSSSQNFPFVVHTRQVSEPSNYKPSEE